MLNDDRTPGVRVLEALPIFPLPNAVLLPGMLLPLNVFERRYLELVDHALETSRIIGIPLLRPGYEATYEGRPEIEPIFGIGPMVSHQRLPDGRRFIRLEGMHRVRVVREHPPRASFRELEVELLPEQPPQDTHQLDVLLAQLERIAATLRPEDRQLVESVLGIPERDSMIYAMAAILPTLIPSPAPAERRRSPMLDLQQRCLAAETADLRVEHLLDAAAGICDRLLDTGRFPRTVMN